MERVLCSSSAAVLLGSATLSPALAACWELIPEAGITRVADITGLDEIGLCVTSVVRPNSRALTVSSGKGSTISQACISGLMEGLEIFHAERFADWIPFGELPRDCVVPDLSDLPHTDDKEAPKAAKPRLRMATGLELISGETAAVPFGLVHTDFRSETLQKNDGFVVCSNGLGGGSCYKDAATHALCEVIEGDAIALFKASQPGSFGRVDWRAIEDDESQSQYARCRSLGIAVTAWDITTEIGVPCYYCRLVERERGPVGIPIATDGAGCHPLPAIALRRALFEAIQTRVLLISGARDDLRPRHYFAKAPNDRGTAEIRLRDSECSDRTASGLLKWLVSRLVVAGFRQAIVVDLKSRSSHLSFVRVVVPGLEAYPYAVGYTKGRRARAAKLSQ